MWTLEMENDFYASLDRATSDARVRVIVVTGGGQTFCPGLDPLVLDGIRGGKRYTTNRRPQTYATTIPKPIIGAINGACAGIGLVQALCFDYRFAARERSSRPRSPSAGSLPRMRRRGCSPGSSAPPTPWTCWPRAGSSSRRRRTARGRAAGERAGAVLDDAVAYAREMAAAVSPVAMAMIKSQVWRDCESTMEQARVRAQHLLTQAKAQPDFQEGVRSLVEKRSPAFAPYQALNF